MSTNRQLKLVTNEFFGDVACDFYRIADSDEVLLTREQIGTALEYENPRAAIAKIHLRHHDRLDKHSVRIPFEKGVSTLESPARQNTGGEQETVFYDSRGVMEICRWSQQPKANAFIDFVWEVMNKFLKGELAIAREMGCVYGSIPDVLCELKDSVVQLAVDMGNMAESIRKIEKSSSYTSYYVRMMLRSGYDNRWASRQGKRVRLLAEFIGIEDKKLLQKIYREMERRYGVELNKFCSDYRKQTHKERCSTLAVISFNITLKEMFDAIVTEMMSFCKIPEPQESMSDSEIEKLFSELSVPIS